jgi:NADPH-dependent 2,4-dienoyl-CoA reductase/sulfur reductase-like enzyme
MSELQFEIVVVGAGPAGLAAACTAAESGRRVALVDETPWLGGQIWRGEQAGPKLSSAQTWFKRFRESGATLLDSTGVIAVPQPELLVSEKDGQPVRISWQSLIIATGARELFIPFPGWTLPGVMGAGGLLGLVKNGWPVSGQRVVVAGSGPLLLAAARGLKEHGARVISIYEQTARDKVLKFGLGLWRYPAKLWQATSLKMNLRGVPYHCGAWPVSAEGNEQISSVHLTDGQRTWREECDLLACGFGLVPNVELALALGCKLTAGDVQVDSMQMTSVPKVYCAGELTGIGGAEAALVEGQIAGWAAAGNPERARQLFGQREAWKNFKVNVGQAFALRPELKNLATDDTIICRCEDVPFGQVRAFGSWREAKLQSRCGMGPCQGRVCGPATQVLLGWGMESVRPPICPARVQSLITEP